MRPPPGTRSLSRMPWRDPLLVSRPVTASSTAHAPRSQQEACQHAQESGAYAGFPCERAGSCPTQGGFPDAVSQDWQRSGKAIGAEGGSRTHTPFRVHDFESCASASSATSALIRHTAVCYRRPPRLDQQPPSVNRSGNGPTGTGASFSAASDALRLASLAPSGLGWLAAWPSTPR